MPAPGCSPLLPLCPMQLGMAQGTLMVSADVSSIPVPQGDLGGRGVLVGDRGLGAGCVSLSLPSYFISKPWTG